MMHVIPSTSYASFTCVHFKLCIKSIFRKHIRTNKAISVTIKTYVVIATVAKIETAHLNKYLEKIMA